MMARRKVKDSTASDFMPAPSLFDVSGYDNVSTPVVVTSGSTNAAFLNESPTDSDWLASAAGHLRSAADDLSQVQDIGLFEITRHLLENIARRIEHRVQFPNEDAYKAPLGEFDPDNRADETINLDTTGGNDDHELP